MADRVTDQEKKLWICNTRDGYSIDEIVANSGRAKSTVYKYITSINQTATKKQETEEVCKIESVNEWKNYYQDGMDKGGDPYENMSVSERSAYEFIESGGCNGASLWNSEIRRSLALEMMQYSDRIIINADLYSTDTVLISDVEKWSRWLAPIAADWALTEGREKYNIAKIYGLTATLVLDHILLIYMPSNPIFQILEDVNKRNKEQNESLRTQLFLAAYRYLGIKIATHLKNNTDISKFYTQDRSEFKQAFLLGYTYTLCGEHTVDNYWTEAETCSNVLNIFTPFKDPEYRNSLYYYTEKGYRAAHEDAIAHRAQFINHEFRSHDNILNHLKFLIRHHYITTNP